MKKFIVLVILVCAMIDRGSLDDVCNAKNNNKCFADSVFNDSKEINMEKWAQTSNMIKKSINDSKSANISEVQFIRFNNGISLDIKEENRESDLIKTLSKKVLSKTRPFDPSRSPSTSPQCKLHTRQFMESLKQFDLWALKMHDSSSKISSGILNGNVNYFGDFDQCLNVEGPDNDFQGKYCLTYLQASIPDNLPRYKKLYDMMHSHGAFVSEFDDPGHRVPRFSMLNWAVCVPSSCTPMDVQNSLKMYVNNFTAGTGINVKIRVDPNMCQIKTSEPFDKNTKIAGLFFLTILGIALLATLIDFKVDNPNPWFVAFSLKKNLSTLCSLDRDPNDIGSIHGIRFMNAVLLIMAHKSMAMFFDPYINRTKMAEALGQPWTVLGRAASIYTDPFLLFSGLLTSYSLIGRLQRKQSPRLLQEYVGRFLRIVPTLGALILFCTYILPHLGSGPQWNLVVTRHAGICKQHWWRNLLFIHNYFGFENMCLTHTHHLGIDTELFVAAPILVLILWKWPKKGALFLLALAGISTVGRFHVTVVEKLSNYVYFGTSIQRLFRTADYMYTLPLYRATIYILGIMLGYVLRMYRHIKLTQTQMKIGWYVNGALFLSVLIGPAPMGSIDYVYNEYHAAIYAAFGPMAWCGIFAWIVFTSHIGYTNYISDFLSWRGFLITTRLSYAIYLTQFPVFFFNVGQKRHAENYSFIGSTFNLHEYIWIGITSIVLTIFFDSPFQNIKKILFKPTPKSSLSSSTTTNSSPITLSSQNDIQNLESKELIYSKSVKDE